MHSLLSSYNQVSIYPISKETTHGQINLFLPFNMPHVKYILTHIFVFSNKKAHNIIIGRL